MANETPKAKVKVYFSPYGCGQAFLSPEAQKEGGLLLLEEAPQKEGAPAPKGILVLNPRTGRTRLMTYKEIHKSTTARYTGVWEKVKGIKEIEGFNGSLRIGETREGKDVYLIGRLGVRVSKLSPGITYATTSSHQYEAVKQLKEVGFVEYRRWFNTYHSGGAEAPGALLTLWRAEK